MELKKIEKGNFIVSCQALEHEPLFGKGIMTKMAKAALSGGANCIRTSQLENIKSIMKEVDVAIIGIIKKNYGNNPVYITPTIKELKELIDTGVHIIAIDATLRKRPNESLNEMVDFFKNNKQNHQLLMADCSDEEDVKNADKLEFNIIGTTLRGYTKQTKGYSNIENDFEFLRRARNITKKFLIAEGGFNTPILASASLQFVDAVVVGSAITRPTFITKMFSEEIKRDKKNDK